jgi:hypothetical protein
MYEGFSEVIIFVRYLGPPLNLTWLLTGIILGYWGAVSADDRAANT